MRTAEQIAARQAQEEATGIVNRVAASPLVVFNLEELLPTAETAVIDIQHQLYQGLMLREKDFRDWAKTHPWQEYQGKWVAITCGTDAIVPSWAYMLLTTYLAPYAVQVIYGDQARLEEARYHHALAQLDYTPYAGEKVVLKGCGAVPVSAYVEATRHLTPLVDKLMFGEPCSVVPLYRAAKG